MDRQQGRRGRVVGQQLQRLCHLRRRGIGAQHQRRCRHGRPGEQRLHRLQRAVLQRRQAQARARGGLGGQCGGPAAVAEDQQLLAAVGAKARQRLRRQQHLLQAGHAQHAGAGDDRVIDAVGRGRCAVGRPAHDDHRLVARRRARRRQEPARRVGAFQAQQDGARAAVAGQVVEQVGDVDVGLRTERQHGRKTDVAGTRPVQHRRGQRRRLRHQRQLAGRGVPVCDAGIQPQVRRQQAGAARAQHPQPLRMRRIEHRLALHRVQGAAEHDGDACAAAAEFGDHLRHGGGRRAHQRQVGRRGQVGHARIHGLAVQAAVARVDRIDGAVECRAAQVVPGDRADAAGTRRRADHHHRARVEQRFDSSASAQDGSPVQPAPTLHGAPRRSVRLGVIIEGESTT